VANDSVTLTSKGRTKWKLKTPRNAGAVERFAAEELKEYVEQISGTRLAAAKSKDAQCLVQVGLRKDLRVRGLPEAKPGLDGYSVLVSPKSIIIAGDNPRGVLYGTYDFLERLGCRWFHPTLDPKDPEVVPQTPDISLSKDAWSESARIEDRFYWMSSLAFNIIPERVISQLDWAAKNRYSGLSWQCVWEKIDGDIATFRQSGIYTEMAKRGLLLHGPGHCFPYFLSTEKYFEKHPEWFGLRDGKRQPHGGVWPATTFCLCNSKAKQTFIRNVLAFAKRNPEIKRLDLIPIDGGRPCQCDKCLKQNPTDQMVELFNTISEHLVEIAPDIILDTVPGYCPIEKPPEKAIPNGLWQGVYAHWGRNHGQSYNDPDYSRRQNLLVWASYLKRFWICSYYAANSHQPFVGPPYIHAILGDTEFMVQQGITGAFVLEYPFDFWWSNSFNVRMGGIYPYYYPKRDPISEIRDYCANYYGPCAGRLLTEYYLMLGDTENLNRTYRASRGEAEEADVVYLEEMQTMIRRAQQLVEGDPVYSYRVSKLAMGMEMLLHLGPSRGKVIEIEAAAEECLQGKRPKEEIDAMIAEARAMIAALEAHAERLASADNGVIAADWVKSWTLHRTYTPALQVVEKKLEGISETVEQKPEHVVDTNL